MLIENLEPRTVFAIDGQSLPSAFSFTVSPISSELRVNQNVPGAQRVWDEANSVVTHSDGSFIVSFSGNGNGDYDGVFVRRFHKDGVPVGGDIPVYTTKTGSQNIPSIATNASRTFIVAWTGKGNSDSNGIYFRRFKSDGAPLGSEQMANVTTSGNQTSPSVGMANDGSFVIAWEGKGPGDSNGIFLRRFNPDGTAAGAETRVNVTTKGDQRQPQIAMATDGRFAVAWYGKGTADELGVYLQRYDKTAKALGTEARVNQTIAGPQTSPAIAMNSAGRIMVAWEGKGEGHSNGIFFRQVLQMGRSTGMKCEPTRL